METIKIEIGVKIDLSAEVKDFLASLFTPSVRTSCASVQPAQTTPAATVAPSTEKPQGSTPIEQPTTSAANPSVLSSSSISIEEVRGALSKKVNDHREAIKEKLTALGAPSITKLDPAKYEEMLNFLNAL